jgi:hypothetical protein
MTGNKVKETVQVIRNLTGGDGASDYKGRDKLSDGGDRG